MNSSDILIGALVMIVIAMAVVVLTVNTWVDGPTEKQEGIHDIMHDLKNRHDESV